VVALTCHSACFQRQSGSAWRRRCDDLDVEEYRQKTKLQQFGYWVFRHPLMMFGLGPIYMFLISHRFALKQYGKKESRSVLDCNLALLEIATILSIVMDGFGNYLKIQIPV
jgi:omega-6 fatty acid desaturase (delta-12 desaturase)